MNQATQQPQPNTPSSSRWRWMLGLLLLSIILAAVALEGIRWQAERVAAERLQAMAHQRGWSLTWSKLHLKRDLSLTIDNLTASDVHSTITINALKVDWKLQELLNHNVEPDAIEIKGLVAAIDVRSLQALGTDTTLKPTTANPRVTSRLMHTRLSMADSAVTIQTGRAELPTLAATQLTLRGDHIESAWKADLHGTCTKGCGPHDVTWSAKLKRSVQSKSAHLAFDAPVQLPLVGDLQKVVKAASFQGLNIVQSPDASIVEVLDTKASLAKAAWAAHTTIARVSLPLDMLVEAARGNSNDGLVLTLEQPTVQLSKTDNTTTATPPSEPRVLRHTLQHYAERIPELAQAVLPKITRFVVKRGSVTYPSRALEVTDIEGHPTEGGYVIQGSHKGMRGGVELTPQTPYMTFLFEEVPVERLTATPQLTRAIEALPTKIQDLKGQLSGRIAVEALQGTLQTNQATIARNGLRIRGVIKAKNSVLEVHSLAPGPLHVEKTRFDFDATGWWPTSVGVGAELQITQAALTLPSRHDGSDVTLRATAHLHDIYHEAEGRRLRKPQVTLSVFMDARDCAAAVGAIPQGMVPNLHDQLQVSGRFAPRLEFSIDMRNLHSARLDIQGLPGTCTITDLGRYDPSFLAGDFKLEVREGVSKKGIFVGPDSGAYVPLGALPRHLRVVTYATEEPRFYSNKGFDIGRTTGAVRLNLERKRYVYGGSTITQQLVKNLFLTRQKTLSRKLEEAFIVWKIEDSLSKNRILELYLNCIEFGPNLYGIAKASWFYFGKPASRLSVMESAFLASLKPMPSMGIGPRSKGRTPDTGFWPERLHGVLGRMGRMGVLSKAKIESMKPYVVYFRNWKGTRG